MEAWGKRDRAGGAAGPVLPLADHCLDVACVAEALLAESTFRRRLARLGGFGELDRVQVARLCVIAGLHDIGKANHAFQGKWKAGAPRGGHVGEALALLDDLSQALLPDDLGPPLLDALSLRVLDGWFRSDSAWGLGAVLEAAICHHGGPAERVPSGHEIWRPREGAPDPVREIGRISERMRQAFPDAFGEGEALDVTWPLVHAFGGLMMLADWVGSDETRFVYRSPTGPDRIPFARAEARRAIEEIGLSGSALRSRLSISPGLPAVLPGKKRARPAQSVIDGLPVPEEGDSLVVIESDTGSGKTEAALLWFLRNLAAGRVDGMYFALPTRAAAVQIWQRVRAIASRWFGGHGPPVILAVPGYLGRTAPRTPILAPPDRLWSDRPPGPAWAEENPKRYLAGAIVVGTIDQVLLSSLDVRHSRLRAAALLRHLLVVDEVHASDAYMSRILEDVVRRQRRAGGHVLLLSATLGATLRCRLTGEPTPALTDARKVPYPLVTRLAGTSTPHPVQRSDRQRAIRMERGPAPDAPSEVALLAVRAARAGARVLVIRNTVSDCVAVQVEVEARDPQIAFAVRGIAAPHHSRFAPADRKRLDQEVEVRFGEAAGSDGVVLVATQTCEQSLDIDADLLITDLCPADVLLQRLGRLHRHQRPPHARPEAYRAPRCLVLLPEPEVLSDAASRWSRDLGFARGPHGYGPVYGDLRVLEITRRLVLSKPEWRVPDDCRPLVEDTTHPEALAALDHEAGTPWREHGRDVAGKRLGQGKEAFYCLAPWDRAYGDATRPTDEARIRTRLGTDALRIPLPPKTPGPFGADVDLLPVPGWQLRGVEGEPEGEVLSLDPLRIRVGEAVIVYDRHGVRPEGDGA